MAGNVIPLLEVDEVQVSIVMDNTIDVLMGSSQVARRFRLKPNEFDERLPIAGHGFSALLTVKRGDETAQVMFDTGVSPTGILHNMDAMEIDAGGLRAIVLSHGHADHAMGMPGLLGRLGSRNLPLVLHPEAYLERKLVLPNGDEVYLRPPRRSDFLRENIELIEEVGPSMLVDGMILVSGEVARTTEFEKGFPMHQAKRDGHWEPDPWIHDDQCAIVHVRGKGLVIVTGCGHSGVINIVRNAQSITGVQAIYGVIGGFHLTGPLFEPIIEQTVAALKELAPNCLDPGHCTGWKAVHRIAAEIPDAFIATSVGTTFVL
jgi:7,8-dihydropterin-6-yl-methyl-4-(beta-D-ribofuranosyl)aminobenzene 5'-phosphate synthase